MRGKNKKEDPNSDLLPGVRSLIVKLGLSLNQKPKIHKRNLRRKLTVRR